MKKGVFIVLTCVMSTVLMFILYFLSGTINHKKNSFIRLFPPHPVILFKTIDIKFNSWYIAGETANHIYLGNVTAPLHVLDINTLNGDTREVIIKMNESKKYAIRSMKLTVDSPRFYLADGVTPALLRGNISDWQAGRYLFDSLYFSQSVPLGETSFVVRVFHRFLQQDVLAKEMMDSPYYFYAPKLLEKQIEGLFSVDGTISYDKEINRVVYIYYYRNEFICTDTNLKLLFRGKTIDTISHAHINVTIIKSENKLVMGSPPLMVNKRTASFGNYLFINSALTAKNEDQESFKTGCPIDAYSLVDGKYKFSFYLFDSGNKSLLNFAVCRNRLLAVYDHYLNIYRLNPKYF